MWITFEEYSLSNFFNQVYRHVNDIDLYTGLLLEKLVDSTAIVSFGSSEQVLARPNKREKHGNLSMVSTQIVVEDRSHYDQLWFSIVFMAFPHFFINPKKLYVDS